MTWSSEYTDSAKRTSNTDKSLSLMHLLCRSAYFLILYNMSELLSWESKFKSHLSRKKEVCLLVLSAFYERSFNFIGYVKTTINFSANGIITFSHCLNFFGLEREGFFEEEISFQLKIQLFNFTFRNFAYEYLQSSLLKY